MRRGPRPAVRLLRRARHRPPALRQADRGHRRGTAAGARAVAAAAAANGVELESLSGAAACALEPQLACVAALSSTANGHYRLRTPTCWRCWRDAESRGGNARLRQHGHARRPRGRRRRAHRGERRRAASCGTTAAGQQRRTGGAGAGARSWRASGRARAARRTTPRAVTSASTDAHRSGVWSTRIPEPGGLGIHLTLDLGGRARFGPDVEWIDSPDYDVDVRRARAFLRRDPPLLAGAARRGAAARVRRGAAEDQRSAARRRRTSASTTSAATACPECSICSVSSRRD